MKITAITSALKKTPARIVKFTVGKVLRFSVKTRERLSVKAYWEDIYGLLPTLFVLQFVNFYMRRAFFNRACLVLMLVQAVITALCTKQVQRAICKPAVWVACKTMRALVLFTGYFNKEVSEELRATTASVEEALAAKIAVPASTDVD